jgi:hypothetical protein
MLFLWVYVFATSEIVLVVARIVVTDVEVGVDSALMRC